VFDLQDGKMRMVRDRSYDQMNVRVRLENHNGNQRGDGIVECGFGIAE
jgi:hypothetical protein